MKPTMKKMTCRVLVVSLLALSFQTANAGMISADRAAGTAPADRALVLSVLDRVETTAQLQAQGIDPALARERVASMTDEEVRALAQDIQTAPAGAMSDWAWVAVILIAAAVWYYAYRQVNCKPAPPTQHLAVSALARAFWHGCCSPCWRAARNSCPRPSPCGATGPKACRARSNLPPCPSSPSRITNAGPRRWPLC